MTTDEVLQAAKEAGFGINHAEADAILFTRFASLVAAAEREACAKVCDSFKNKTLGAQSGPDDELSNVILRQVANLGHAECAAAIRARSTP